MGSPTIEANDNGKDFGIGASDTSAIANSLIIQGNHISNHAFGIYAGYGDTGAIVGNIIRDIPGQHGIYVQPGERMVITGNTLYNIAQVGIKVQLSDASAFAKSVTITGNTINRCRDHGIDVGTTLNGVEGNSTAHAITITGNVITDGYVDKLHGFP
jgi:hypothetical protein